MNALVVKRNSPEARREITEREAMLSSESKNVILYDVIVYLILVRLNNTLAVLCLTWGLHVDRRALDVLYFLRSTTCAFVRGDGFLPHYTHPAGGGGSGCLSGSLPLFTNVLFCCAGANIKRFYPQWLGATLMQSTGVFYLVQRVKSMLLADTFITTRHWYSCCKTHNIAV